MIGLGRRIDETELDNVWEELQTVDQNLSKENVKEMR